MLLQWARSAGAADDIHSRAHKKQPGRQQLERKLEATLWWFTAAPKPLKIQVLGGHPAPRGRTAPIF